MKEGFMRHALTIFVILIAAASLSAQAQAPARPGDGSATSPETRREAPYVAQVGTQSFVSDLIMAGMAEVQLGKIAAEQAANADIKAFGRMMVADHTKSGTELTQIASRLGVQPPTQLDEKHRELVMRLSALRGAEFDRAYMTAMVEGHEKVAGILRSRASTSDRTTSSQPGAAPPSPTASAPTARPGTGDAAPNAGGRPSAATTVGTAGTTSAEEALTQWAAKTLPTVQQHLERARTLQQQTTR
jgi:putative membrane protein